MHDMQDKQIKDLHNALIAQHAGAFDACPSLQVCVLSAQRFTLSTSFTLSTILSCEPLKTGLCSLVFKARCLLSMLHAQPHNIFNVNCSILIIRSVKKMFA
ncbi:TPA: hypothetical protein ACH3X2_012409 [Trebouxia sp. C0005]